MYIYEHTTQQRKKNIRRVLKLLAHVRDSNINIFDRRQLKHRVITSTADVVSRNLIGELFMVFQCIAYFDHSKQMIKDMPVKVIKRMVQKYHLHTSEGRRSYEDFKDFIKQALKHFMQLYGGFSSHVPNVQHDSYFGFDVIVASPTVVEHVESAACSVAMFDRMYIDITKCNVQRSTSEPCSVHRHLYKWVKLTHEHLSTIRGKRTKVSIF